MSAMVGKKPIWVSERTHLALREMAADPKVGTIGAAVDMLLRIADERAGQGMDRAAQRALHGLDDEDVRLLRQILARARTVPDMQVLAGQAWAVDRRLAAMQRKEET